MTDDYADDILRNGEDDTSQAYIDKFQHNFKEFYVACY